MVDSTASLVTLLKSKRSTAKTQTQGPRACKGASGPSDIACSRPRLCPHLTSSVFLTSAPNGIWFSAEADAARGTKILHFLHPMCFGHRTTYGVVHAVNIPMSLKSRLDRKNVSRRSRQHVRLVSESRHLKRRSQRSSIRIRLPEKWLHISAEANPR